MFTKGYLEFFKELAANNNKEWFDQNRKRYDKEVKKPFNAFIAETIELLRADDAEIDLLPKDAIFRINRDIRFSKDKTPYKTNMAAIISAHGKGDKRLPGMYIQISAEDLRFYSGCHMLEKEDLVNVRNHISSLQTGSR